MTRINVYETDEYETRLVGWYDSARATSYYEGKHWDGNNNISLATGSQWDHERLDHTAGGRWVIYSWSPWQGGPDGARFVADDEAREWMIRNELADETIAEAFGEPVEDETGPGRPAIGRQVVVRMSDEMRDQIDAVRGGLDRAEWIRRVVADALSR